jgi:hypothetical protein
MADPALVRRLAFSGQLDSATFLEVAVTESLSADIDATVEELAQAAMAAADAVADWGKRELRSDTRPALGPKVANTWRSKVYPHRGQAASLAPSVTWWTNAPHIISAFSEGLTVRAGSGKYIMIPTENAPQAGYGFRQFGRIGLARRYAIVQAERKFGKLRYIKVKGKDLILLVADKVQKNKRGYAPASASTLRRRKEENGVVMFVLVPSATMPKLVDPEKIADAIGREGVERFANAFREITRRRFGREGESP